MLSTNIYGNGCGVPLLAGNNTVVVAGKKVNVLGKFYRRDPAAYSSRRLCFQVILVASEKRKRKLSIYNSGI